MKLKDIEFCPSCMLEADIADSGDDAILQKKINSVKERFPQLLAHVEARAANAIYTADLYKDGVVLKKLTTLCLILVADAIVNLERQAEQAPLGLGGELGIEAMRAEKLINEAREEANREGDDGSDD